VWHHQRPKPLEIPQSLLLKKYFEFLQKKSPKMNLLWKFETGKKEIQKFG
jgi:hypothetical protein